MVSFFPKKLYTQTILFVCFLLVSTNFLYSYVVSSRNASIALEQKKKHAISIVDNLVIASAHKIVTGDYSGLELFMLQSAKLPDIREIKVIDSENVTLVYIRHPAGGDPQSVFVRPSKDEIHVIKDSIEIDNETLRVTQSIIAGKPLGMVDIIFSLESIHALQKNIWHNTIVVGILCLTLTIALLLYFLRFPINTVQKLSEFARGLNEKTGEKIDINYPSFEFKQLAEAINLASIEIQQAKQELSDERERLDITMQSINDGVIATDISQKVILLNKAAEKMTGWTLPEAMGEKIYNIFLLTSHGEHDYPENPVQKVLNSGNTFEYHESLVLEAKKGTHTNIVCSGAPIINRVDKMVGVVIVFRDISDKKKMEDEKEKLEAQLQQAQKMEAIGTLAGGIAHDFNNILTPILGYAEILQMSIPQEDPQFQHVNEIFTAANRAKELVQQILSFSRQTEHELQPLQIHIIVKEVIKLLHSSIPSTIEIRQNIEPNGGCVLGDPTKIHQIIMNLCTNAYHAMKEKGGVLGISLCNVEITSKDYILELDLSPGNYVRLEICDTGGGVPEAIKDRIFEPYFTTKQKGEGTGLGLSVVHGIVKSLKGHITFYSEKGEGTCFHVYLPKIQGTQPTAQISSSHELPTGNERLLVVDDEESVLGFESNILSSLGYKVRAFSSSKEAYWAFKKTPEDFDLIITDMTMPELTGGQLAQKIISIRAEVPIILCTGFSEIINEEKAKALGVKAYVTKPIIVSHFAKTIREVLN